MVPSENCTSIAANLFNCSFSNLDIPGTFADKLTIYLRRDYTTLANPNKNEIGSAEIRYVPDAGHEAPNVLYPLLVPPCSDTTYGTLPLSGIPCIKLRTRYKSNAPAAWALDWEFMILAIDNGRYIN
jgi:hypothetical protein